MRRITASLVIYKTPLGELQALFSSLSKDHQIVAWAVVDNAAAEDAAQGAELLALVEHLGGVYVAMPSNAGFGSGHNAALAALHETPSDFHVMLNPDIVFGPNVLTELTSVMDTRPRVGLILPRVRYPDGADQFLCKLLPTPADFALRRFAPNFIQRLARRRMNRYELRGLEDSECDCVPFLSGCFMFTRRKMLEAVRGFDEGYFLYVEDVDLCRRLSEVGGLLYWPHVSVMHGYHRGAHRNVRLMFAFLRSSVRYFNRWGWFFDGRRRDANRAALARLDQIAARRQSES